MEKLSNNVSQRNLEVVQQTRPQIAENDMTFPLETDMILIPFTEFKKFGKIPRSSDRHEFETTTYAELCENTDERAETIVVFISHRWLNPSNDPRTMHPDVEDHSKYKMIVEGLQRLLSGVEAKEVFIWIDFCSLEQDDPEKLGKGVKSLPGYIERSDVIFTPYNSSLWDGVEDKLTAEFLENSKSKDMVLFTREPTLLQYISRGWCRFEMFCGSNAPMMPVGFEYFKKMGISTRTDRPHLLFGETQRDMNQLPEVAPRIANSIFKHLNPAQGAVTVESDRVALKSLVERFDMDFEDEDKYDGELDSEGKPHGNGKMVYSTGSIYQGEWVHGEYEGQGSFLYTNGTLYSGGWKNSKRHNKGVHHLSNGLRYEGTFLDGNSHGPGQLYFQNGNLKFKGTKNKTKWEGELEEYYPNGQLKYKGDSFDNQWHGMGKEFDEDGNLIREGVFEKGEFVGSASSEDKKRNEEQEEAVSKKEEASRSPRSSKRFSLNQSNCLIM